jgi:signal transduction histidine kinase
MVAYASVIVAVLILLNTYPLIMTQNMMFQSKKNSLQGQALVISNTLPGTEKLTEEGVSQAFSLLEDLRYTRIMVTNETGLVLFDTGEEPITGKYALVNGLVSALRGNDVFYGEYKNGVFRSWAASPVMVKGRIVGAVYLYESDEEQGMLLREVQNNLRLISVLVCGMVFLISGLLSRAFTSRIAALLAAIRMVREGEYTHRIQTKGQDELSQLGEEFNQLTGRLQVTEEARRRFVSDASHELKTPLASIKLLTDSILQEDMEAETTKEFVADIGEAADRLIRISEDLLTLNRLDAGQKRKAQPVEVSRVVQQLCLLLAPLAQAASVTIRTKLEPGCYVFTHEGELSQIILNLMENAIKYNFPQGLVMVSLRKTEEAVILTVEDTGVGIPEEDLPYIFERFYRVDKARSREAGGTGLGLAIVWETVRLHGGTIEVSPRADGGVCMTVTFPRYQEGGLP